MPSPDPDFDQALDELGRSLQKLQDRYAQVKADQQRQETLHQRIEQAQRDYASTQDLSLKLEIKRLKDQLVELEVALESQLFSWSSLKEPFWMAVRFGGLGIVLGWLLKSLAG
jgi:ribosome-associated translation inhibitor RaiA